MDRVDHRYAENAGVKIHYVVAGAGPLVVMVHGFPDFWYSWRDQIAALEDTYRIAAVDLRGYNDSDKPEGVENYAMRRKENRPRSSSATTGAVPSPGASPCRAPNWCPHW